MLSYQAASVKQNCVIKIYIHIRPVCISIWYNRSQMRFHFVRHVVSLSLSLFLSFVCNLSSFSASANRQQIVRNVPAGVDFNEHHTKATRACVHPIDESTRVARVTQRQPTHQRFVTCNYYQLKAILHAG